MKSERKMLSNSNAWIARIAVIFLTVSFTAFKTSGQGTVTNIKFYSPSLEMERNVQIYFLMDTAEQDSARYPVLYFLHGADQNSSSHSVLFTIYKSLIRKQGNSPLHHRQTGWKLPALGTKLLFKLGIVW